MGEREHDGCASGALPVMLRFDTTEMKSVQAPIMFVGFPAVLRFDV